jgi:hypothetical protein
VVYRVTLTDGQEKWPIIREFDVHTQNDMIAQSNMTPAEGSDVQRACDGNRWSAFESASPVKQDDWIQIDLGAQAPVIKKITVLMGVSNYFVNAAVERSVDGVNWDQIGTTSDRAFQVSIQPEKTRYIRIISNQDQDKSVGVHEISVEK